MESTSFDPIFWYETSPDVEVNNSIYMAPSYPPDIATIQDFLRSPITNNVGNSNEVDDPFKLSDVIDVIETDTVLTDLDNPIFSGDLSEPVPSTTFGEGQGLVLQPRPAIPTVPNNLGAVPKGGRGVKQLQDEFGTGNGEGILIPELMMTTPVTHQPKR
nr:uncharacterized protein LOC111514737 isoform X1 [Leptinotarsa decemlineata]